MTMMLRLTIVVVTMLALSSAFDPPTSVQHRSVKFRESSTAVSLTGDYAELARNVAIVAAFGGGLIPAAITANKAMIGTLTGKRRGGEDVLKENQDASKSLDPTLGDTKNRAYIENSGALGPRLPNSALLFANEDIPLVDVIAIMGRIADVNSIADWQDLPSTKLPNIANTANPPMWLPRGAFKVNIRRAKWLSWPTDPNTGEPVGGEELKRAEESRISKQGAAIGDAALDAVWDTWAWGASIATPDKVDAQLRGYKPNSQAFDVNKLAGAAVRGRSVTAFAALTFIVIQLIVYSSLFVAPILRTFFDIDIGLGEMGTCNPETCTKLF